MKLEMGESLVFSWLKHEKHCQVVQMNWKASQEWDTLVPENVEKTYQDAKKFFKEKGNFCFVSENVKTSNQFIKQGEIDTIGIELDTTISGKIKTIHAVDVAFHEAGLHYGSEEETKARIIKKYIRTALSIYKYFGIKEAEIYFVTPNTAEKQRKTYVEAKDAVKKFFDENNFKFSFHFYSNKDFYSEIFHPVERISKVENDTSELFVRSLKLVHLMDNETTTQLLSQELIIDNSKSELTYLEERKIGTIAREAFDYLSKNQILEANVINELQDKTYSKVTFGSGVSVLVEIKEGDDSQRFDEKGNARYYSAPYTFNNKNYYLTNDWYDRNDNKNNLIKWYNSVRK